MRYPFRTNTKSREPSPLTDSRRVSRRGKGWWGSDGQDGPLKASKQVPTPHLLLAPSECPRTKEDCLLYHGEPLIMWLRVPGRHLLAIACETEDPSRQPMLVCELTAHQARLFEAREEMLCDVVYGAQRWYDIPDYNAAVVELYPRERLPRDLPAMEGYLP